MNGLQRIPWDGTARELGDCWRLMKAGDGIVRCVIVNHPFGWELRLLHADELLRSHLFREQTRFIETAGQ